MDKRIMKFKLLSYMQALRKAKEKDDKGAVKRWTDSIAELQHEIDETR